MFDKLNIDFAGLKPAFVKDNPVMIEAYSSFIDWAFRNEDARKAFEAETGMAPYQSQTNPDAAAVEYMTAFVTWATVTQWGVEADDHPVIELAIAQEEAKRATKQ